MNINFKGVGEKLRVVPFYFNTMKIKKSTHDFSILSRYGLNIVLFILVFILPITSAIAQESYESYYNKGNDYASKGQWDAAIQNYSKAIELNPKDAETYNNRGNAYAEMGQLRLAINDFTKVI